MDRLLTDDPVFSTLPVQSHDLKRPYYGPGFAGLVRIVAGQQVSTGAARAMWEKLQQNVDPMTPANALALDDDVFRQSGMSRQKTVYIKSLARVMEEGAFDPGTLESLNDEDVTAAITALKGFGPWSAEIYLMFCMARPDIWPAGDLGIQYGLQKYLSLPEKPDEDTTRREGERFAPYRTAASILLWYMKAN